MDMHCKRGCVRLSCPAGRQHASQCCMPALDGKHRNIQHMSQWPVMLVQALMNYDEKDQVTET